jgi:hypothetical protein
VHDGIGSMRFESGAHLAGVVNIRPSKGDAGWNRFGMPLGQIVDHGNGVPRFDQGTNGMAADVTGSACNHHSRQRYLPIE